jgi:hypothetical protein
MKEMTFGYTRKINFAEFNSVFVGTYFDMAPTYLRKWKEKDPD